MSDLWYRSCRGVAYGGHRLAVIKMRRWFVLREHHLICAEPGCDLFIVEPRFRTKRVRISRYIPFTTRARPEVTPSVMLIAGCVGFAVLAFYLLRT